MGEARPPGRGLRSRGIGLWVLVGLALVLIGTLGLIWLLYLSRPTQPRLPEPIGVDQLLMGLV
jgi:hypothetical protein